MKNIFVHIGFPRTGTTTLQIHLFPKHPQINYLGRTPREKPHLPLIDLVCNLNDDDFNHRYKEALKICSNFEIDENKTNILSSEFIISFATHYNNGLDKNNNVTRSLNRIHNLFKDINVKVNFFCSIRNQTTIIPSFYSVTSPDISKSSEGKRSMTYNAEQIIDHIKNVKIDNKKIKNFLDGYKYWSLYNEFNKTFKGETKLTFFIYEEYNNEFPTHISNYLRIDKNITRKLIYKKNENSQKVLLNQHPAINSKFSIFFSKFKNNFLSPSQLLVNFDKKISNFYFLFKDLIIKRKIKNNIVNIHEKRKNFNYQLNILKKKSSIIKEYYREDNLKLLNELKVGIDKYDYF